jgi:hypothetical protein
MERNPNKKNTTKENVFPSPEGKRKVIDLVTPEGADGDFSDSASEDEREDIDGVATMLKSPPPLKRTTTIKGGKHSRKGKVVKKKKLVSPVSSYDPREEQMLENMGDLAMLGMYIQKIREYAECADDVLELLLETDSD